MHEYSINTDKTKIIALLAIFSSALAALINSVITDYSLLVKIPISFSLIFGLLYWILNKTAWKWFLKSNTPNISGVWEGTFKTSYDQFTNINYARLEIEQSWTKICIRGFFNKSKSHSTIAAIKTDAASVQIFYLYLNEGDPELIEGTMVMHAGHANLEFNRSSNTLEGTYFNNPIHKNNNHGKLILTKVKSKAPHLS